MAEEVVIQSKAKDLAKPDGDPSLTLRMAVGGF